MPEKFRRFKTWLSNTFDLNDLFVFGGLAAACYGLGQIHAPSAWIVGGAVSIWLGKFK